NSNSESFNRDEIYKEFEIVNISNTKITSRIKGEKIDEARHEIYTEVKAVTYHDLYIKQIAQGWEAQVIFDL
ncbi:MAG: archease, partial [bacterium]